MLVLHFAYVIQEAMLDVKACLGQSDEDDETFETHLESLTNKLDKFCTVSSSTVSLLEMPDSTREHDLLNHGSSAPIIETPSPSPSLYTPGGPTDHDHEYAHSLIQWFPHTTLPTVPGVRPLAEKSLPLLAALRSSICLTWIKKLFQSMSRTVSQGSNEILNIKISY